MRDYILHLLVFSGGAVITCVVLYLSHLKNNRLGENRENLVKKRTHDLEMQTAMLETVFSAIPDLIFCKDVNGYFTECNNSFARYIHVKKEDIIGKNDAILFDDKTDVHKDYLSADAEVMQTRTMRMIEEEIYSPFYGTSRFFETMKAPLVQNGKVVGVMGISHDITRRKVAEENALVASQAKSEFLARISHEIRTPLNAVMGMTRIARNSINDPEKALKSMDEITNASSHLLGILNDVLDMSKIESGKFEIAKEPFHLVSAMSDVSSIISQRCKEKLVTFKNNINELPDVYVIGDKLRLTQVLINLLGNAVKFTSAGGLVNFNIVIREEKPDELKMIFALSDTGIGMSEEQMKRLFVAFQQADNNIATRYGGTGLGLVISQNLVNLMGGEITVSSEEGVGSIFNFTVTVHKTDATFVVKKSRYRNWI